MVVALITPSQIGTATGQHSFAHEQVSLIGELDSSYVIITGELPADNPRTALPLAAQSWSTS